MFSISIAIIVLVTEYRRRRIDAAILARLQTIFGNLAKRWGYELLEFNGEVASDPSSGAVRIASSVAAALRSRCSSSTSKAKLAWRAASLERPAGRSRRFTTSQRRETPYGWSTAPLFGRRRTGLADLR